MQAAPDWDDISQNQRDLPTSGIEFVSHYRFIWNYGYQDVVLRIAGPAQLQTFERIVRSC